MADVRAILKINEAGNGVLERATSSKSTNNVSSIPYTTDLTRIIENQTIDNKNFNGGIGTPIGASTIGSMFIGIKLSDNTFVEEYKGAIFGYTNSEKILNLDLEIVGTDILTFKIVFDRLVGQYPTEYYWYDINGDEHHITNNTSNEILFDEMLAGYGAKRIRFSKWSLANKPVGITFVESIDTQITLNKSWIVRFKSQVQSSSDSSDIRNEVLTNTGEIVLNDYNNLLYHKAQLGHLNSFVFTLNLYINNNLIQTHTSKESPYYDNDKRMQMQLTNSIERWNKIQVESITFNAGTTLKDILTRVLSYDIVEYEESDINEMLSNDVCDSTTPTNYITLTLQDKFEKIIFNNQVTLKQSSLLNQIQKICAVSETECYLEDNGKVKFTTSRPIMYLKQGIDIPAKKQASALNYDLLVSNRFDEVEFI